MWNPIVITSVLLIPAAVIISLSGVDWTNNQVAQTETIQMETPQIQPEKAPESERIIKSNREWKQELTSDQFFVLRQKGTERPFTGKYDDFFESGVYKCAACGQVLFRSDSKFNSHCGWPAFSDVVDQDKILKNLDRSHGMTRTEVLCSRCGGHLGHVFHDGPPPSGLRYCINSAALEFLPDK